VACETLRYKWYMHRRSAAQLRRLTSHVGTSTSTKLSTAFLGRARATAAEHAKLSQQLAENYDVKTAKKIGELGATTTALSEWEKANAVRTLLLQRFCSY